MINQMEKRVRGERKIMVSKRQGTLKGGLIPEYLTDEGDVAPPIYMRWES